MICHELRHSQRESPQGVRDGRHSVAWFGNYGLRARYVTVIKSNSRSRQKKRDVLREAMTTESKIGGLQRHSVVSKNQNNGKGGRVSRRRPLRGVIRHC